MKRVEILLVVGLSLLLVFNANSQNNQLSSAWISRDNNNLIIDFRTSDSIKLHNLGSDNFKQFPLITKDSLLIGIHDHTSFDTLKIMERSEDVLKLYHYASGKYFQLIEGVDIVDSILVNSIIDNNSINIRSNKNADVQNYELFSKDDLALTTRGIFGMKCKEYEFKKQLKYSDVGTILYLSFKEKKDSWWRKTQSYAILIKNLSPKRISGVLLDDNTGIEITVKEPDQSLTDRVLKIDREDIIGNYAVYRDKEKFKEEIKRNRKLIHIGYVEVQFHEDNSYVYKVKGESKTGNWRIGKRGAIDYLELGFDEMSDEAEFDSRDILLLVNKADRYLIFEHPTCDFGNELENSFNLVKLK